MALIAATRRIFTLQAGNFFVRSIQKLHCLWTQWATTAHSHDGIDASFVDHSLVFGVQYHRWVCRFIGMDANDGRLVARPPMRRWTVAAAAIAPFLQDNESLPINGSLGQTTFPDFDIGKDEHAERSARRARVG